MTCQMDKRKPIPFELDNAAWMLNCAPQELHDELHRQHKELHPDNFERRVIHQGGCHEDAKAQSS